MLQKGLKYLQYGNRFCGLEHTTINGHESISVTVLKKSKKELTINTAFQVDTIIKVSKKIAKRQHAHLIVNNNKVLFKTIESSQKDNLELVNKAFPNINIDDFYFQILHQSSKHFIAICRKEYVDKLIDSYKENNISIIDFSLGNLILSNITEFIESENITTSNVLVSIEGNFITSIDNLNKLETQQYNVNGLETDSYKIVSLTGALQSYFNNSEAKTNYSDTKSILLRNYNEIRFFNQFLKFGLLFIFLLLFANFLIFNNYFNKVNSLQEVSQVNQNNRSLIVKLKEDVDKKQKMVDDLLKSNTSKSSFYANKIIENMPISIMLSEFNYQPLEKRIKPEKPVEIDEKTIIVSGISNNSKVFSSWIATLERTEWIDEVTIADYGSNNISTSEFSLKIRIVND